MIEANLEEGKAEQKPCCWWLAGHASDSAALNLVFFRLKCSLNGVPVWFSGWKTYFAWFKHWSILDRFQPFNLIFTLSCLIMMECYGSCVDILHPSNERKGMVFTRWGAGLEVHNYGTKIMVLNGFWFISFIQTECKRNAVKPCT